MAADAAVSSETPSFTGKLWRRWLARRARNLARRRSQVKFRLTREGVHFVGVLLFIFFGAVIRDINLLILLAGAMIGLLLLQWRFNVRTLVGLTVGRRMPRATTVGRETEIEVSIHNPKRLLGAWLVLIEDPLRMEAPKARKLSLTGASVIDEVRPRGIGVCQYQLKFNERGKYRIGPTTMSTRFPIGLGRGWRMFNNQEELLVRPALGELRSQVKRIFQTELQGHAESSARAGANEAEFYGLRPWATGDSRRWIHWRTTARLGELSVRQFERQQHQQVCVLLDLHRAPKGANAERQNEKQANADPANPLLATQGKAAGERDDEMHEAIEKAISFVATIANSAVLYHRNKMSVALAASRDYVSTGIQSPVLVESLLDELAMAEPCENPALIQSIRGLQPMLMANPYLLVVSTRPDQMDQLSGELDGGYESQLFNRLRVRWLNVCAGDLEPYFRWTLPK